MSNNIPIFSAKEQYPQISADLEAAVLEVLRSGNYIMGQKNKTLEQQIAKVCGVKHGIGVANGTDALILAPILSSVALRICPNYISFQQGTLQLFRGCHAIHRTP